MLLRYGFVQYVRFARFQGQVAAAVWKGGNEIKQRSIKGFQKQVRHRYQYDNLFIELTKRKEKQHVHPP